MMRLTSRWLALPAIALAFGMACSGGSPPKTPTAEPTVALDAASMTAGYAGRGPFGAGVTTIDLVDTSRGTAENREAPALAERRLPVEVWYPAAPGVSAPEARDVPLADAGPYPLVVFAHGFSSFRRQSATFAQHLASHGYVVASPDFPESNIAAPGGPRLQTVLEQPDDVSFVIDELLARGEMPDGLLAGAIDPDRIGMSGHSLGGMTAMLTGYGTTADPRVRAIVPISPPGCMLGDDRTEGPATPTMVIGGSRELIVAPSSIHDAYERAGVPKYYVEVIGADHARFGDFDITDEELGDFVDEASRGDLTEDANAIADATGADLSACEEGGAPPGDALITGERQRELMRIAATPFLDAYVRDDAMAMRFLHEALPSLAGVRVEMDLGSD